MEERPYIASMQVTLEIPDEIAQQLPVAPAGRHARLLLELAVALYAKGTLSLAQAAQFAGMNRTNLGWEIGQRGIPRHYGEEELTEDLAYASRQ
jgi:predicted HTH domain antitoxin